MTRIPVGACTTAMLLIAALAFAHGGGDGKIVVETVHPDTPAAAAGLEAGDTIIRLAGEEIAGQEDLERVMTAHRPGDTVSLTVERKGRPMELALTFGARPEGGVSIGVSLAISTPQGEGAAATSGETLTREECVAWVADTYRVDAMLSELALDLADEAERLGACLPDNVQQMPSPMPTGWCDNAFKIHCSGLDLLTEIGEAQVERCEQLLGEPLASCASQQIFDRYMNRGQRSDEAACRASRQAC